MKVLKFITNILLIIVLILSLVATNTLYIADIIINKEYIENILESSSYYEQLSEDINEVILQYVRPSGIDEEMFENLVTVDDVTRDTNTVIENIFDGTQTQISNTFIYDRLLANLENSDEFKSLISANTSQIEDLATLIGKQYNNSILDIKSDKVNQYLTQILEQKDKYKNIPIIVAIVSIVLLLILNIKIFNIFLSNVGISVTSVGAIFIIVKIFIEKSIDIANISIYTQALSNAIKQFLTISLSFVLEIGVIYLIIGLILILISSFVKAGIEISKQKNN